MQRGWPSERPSSKKNRLLPDLCAVSATGLWSPKGGPVAAVGTQRCCTRMEQDKEARTRRQRHQQSTRASKERGLARNEDHNSSAISPAAAARSAHSLLLSLSLLLAAARVWGDSREASEGGGVAFLALADGRRVLGVEDVETEEHPANKELVTRQLVTHTLLSH